MNYGSATHDHGELDKVLKGYMDAIVGSRSLSPVWFDGFSAILDTYLGEVPETFIHDGKEYTAHSFKEYLGLNQDDYISLTSFTHHPFYTAFPIEVPDNWRWANSYNLPVEELMEVMEHAIKEGYTISWASDVSERFRDQGLPSFPMRTPENAVRISKDGWGNRPVNAMLTLEIVLKRDIGRESHYTGDAANSVRQVRNDRRPWDADLRVG